MKRFLMTMSVSLLFMSITVFPPLGFVKNAEAIIGMPWTPFSFAGMARRSMYREAAWSAAAANAAAANAAAASAAAANTAAANAAAANAAAANAAAAQRSADPGSAVPLGTIVPSLPSGCSSVVIGGVNYFNCAGVYYRAGFQGNKIVYIVSQP